MLPLDVRAIGAAYYTGNLHKWVCAPKGAGFLYVRENRRASVRPVAISHGANATRTDRSRFHLEFDWTGTFDPTAVLSIPCALKTIPSLIGADWTEVRRRNHLLALRARDILATRLGVAAPVPDEMIGSMATLLLPALDDRAQDTLLDEFNIEVPFMPWPDPAQRLLRISAQLYNEEWEYERLGDALAAMLRREIAR